MAPADDTTTRSTNERVEDLARRADDIVQELDAVVTQMTELLRKRTTG